MVLMFPLDSLQSISSTNFVGVKLNLHHRAESFLSSTLSESLFQYLKLFKIKSQGTVIFSSTNLALCHAGSGTRRIFKSIRDSANWVVAKTQCLYPLYSDIHITPFTISRYQLFGTFYTSRP